MSETGISPGGEMLASKSELLHEKATENETIKLITKSLND